jgi:hypothetical protein
MTMFINDVWRYVYRYMVRRTGRSIGRGIFGAFGWLIVPVALVGGGLLAAGWWCSAGYTCPAPVQHFIEAAPMPLTLTMPVWTVSRVHQYPVDDFTGCTSHTFTRPEEARHRLTLAAHTATWLAAENLTPHSGLPATYLVDAYDTGQHTHTALDLRLPVLHHQPMLEYRNSSDSPALLTIEARTWPSRVVACGYNPYANATIAMR